MALSCTLRDALTLPFPPFLSVRYYGREKVESF
jgi:hypothetical protein